MGGGKHRAGGGAGSGSLRRMAGTRARRHDVRDQASFGGAAGAETAGATRAAAENVAGIALAAIDRESARTAETGAGDRAQPALESGAAQRAGETGERHPRRSPGRDGSDHPPRTGSAIAEV